MREEWTEYPWYCPNCSNRVTGLKNRNGQIRVECGACGVRMIRTLKGRRHDVIDVFAPDGEERNS